MKTIYVFSGLGADERVFNKTDFGDNKVVFIKWIVPEKKESMAFYSLRLTSQIKTTEPVLIGLSFGGMMAIEVAKHIATKKIILISSAKTKHEIPFYFRLAGKLALHKLIPSKALIRINLFTNWFFSSRTREDKKMLSAILRDTDPVFLKWAIAKIANWQNVVLHKNLVHIHGSADRILPIKYVKCDIKIDKGTHLMIVSKAGKVNERLLTILK